MPPDPSQEAVEKAKRAITQDFSGFSRKQLESALHTEEAANYWLSYGITVWASKASAIEAQVLDRVRERLEPAIAAMASISAATGRARVICENPDADLDGFTVDEELDEIAAQVGELRNALSTLDQEAGDAP